VVQAENQPPGKQCPLCGKGEGTESATAATRPQPHLCQGPSLTFMYESLPRRMQGGEALQGAAEPDRLTFFGAMLKIIFTPERYNYFYERISIKTLG